LNKTKLKNHKYRVFKKEEIILCQVYIEYNIIQCYRYRSWWQKWKHAWELCSWLVFYGERGGEEAAGGIENTPSHYAVFSEKRLSIENIAKCQYLRKAGDEFIVNSILIFFKF
jgi:hypothetical protein